MLDILLITFGKIKDKAIASLIAEYMKRLAPFCRLKLVELDAEPFSDKTHGLAKAREAIRLENYLAKNQAGNVFLLAERGDMMDSASFASFLELESPLTLVIGGALGFSPQMYEKYPALSLSALTLPHELARLILIEQIYRSATILRQKNYHH